MKTNIGYGTSIDVARGSEGPKHDPYSYVEVVVARADGRVARYHGGLIEWCEVNGVRVEHDDAGPTFESAVGIASTDAVDCFYRARSRCRECGCRQLHDESGFPGETFSVCDRCGAIVCTDFNMSAIE